MELVWCWGGGHHNKGILGYLGYCINTQHTLPQPVTSWTELLRIILITVEISQMLGHGTLRSSSYAWTIISDDVKGGEATWRTCWMRRDSRWEVGFMLYGVFRHSGLNWNVSVNHTTDVIVCTQLSKQGHTVVVTCLLVKVAEMFRVICSSRYLNIHSDISTKSWQG